MRLLRLFHRFRRRRGKVVLQSIVRDWRYHEDPQDLPDSESGAYRLKIETSRLKQQTFVSLESERNPAFGAEVFIEVNNGLPCLHLTNVVGGDNVLHLFFTEDGIVVVPEVDNERPLLVSTSRFYPGSRGFSSLYNNPADPVPQAGCAV